MTIMVVEKVTFIHTDSPVPDGYSEIFERMGLGLLRHLEKQYGNYEKRNDDLHEISTKKIKGLKRMLEYLSKQDSADKGKEFHEGMIYSIKALEKAIDSWVSSLPALQGKENE